MESAHDDIGGVDHIQCCTDGTFSAAGLLAGIGEEEHHDGHTDENTGVDKEGGITVNDCELVAREMNEILDREDYVEDSYVFEVSSPGLGRPLKKEKDYIRNMGKEIEIRTYRAINRQKEFTGILKAYDDKSVTITDENGEDLTFEKPDIALVRQALDF